MDNEKILHVLEDLFGMEIESYILTARTEDQVMDVTYGSSMDLAFMHMFTTNTIQSLLKKETGYDDQPTLQ